MDLIYLIIKLVFALIVIFCLMAVTFNYSNKGVSKLNEKKFTKVIDRVQIAKDSYLVTVKIGDKGIVLITSSNHTEKIQELTKEEIEKIENDKKQNYEEMSLFINKMINKIKSKVEKNEKIKS